MISTFYLPTKLIFGPGSLAQLGSLAKEVGKKAIVVTGATSMRKSGVLDRVIQDLKYNGVEAFVFDKVEPNPRSSTVDEGARMAREKGADLVIGLGGGSAMDAAKAIKVASAGTDPFWSYITGETAVKKGPMPSLILVPTIAASGSEASTVTVILNWESHEKRVLHNPVTYPDVSIIDPELTLTVPAKTTAKGGVDIFLHAAERYITAHTPFAINDSIMEATMKVVVESLPQALAKPDDIEARTRLSWASTVANSPLVEELGGSGGSPTLHGIAYPFTSYYDIAHGDTLAALLIAWMKFTIPAKKERFESLGRNVFGESDAILAIDKWLERVGMKLRLRDFAVEPERFEEFAAAAMRMAKRIVDHPVPLDIPAITKIYQDSY